ncbi:MAG TPA: hypothetical protein VKB51_16615 [bacterium]|nr:hypothetical protein [bacterium]
MNAMQRKLLDGWDRWKAPLGWLVVGLVAGPLLSGLLGWQVTTATLHRQVRDAIVTQQAAMCEMRARHHVKDLATLNFDQDGVVAQKYARFPWDPTEHLRVVDRCSNALAREGGTLEGTKPHA